MRRIVSTDTQASSASSFCSILSNARAARICSDVTTALDSHAVMRLHDIWEFYIFLSGKPFPSKGSATLAVQRNLPARRRIGASEARSRILTQRSGSCVAVLPATEAPLLPSRASSLHNLSASGVFGFFPVVHMKQASGTPGESKARLRLWAHVGKRRARCLRHAPSMAALLLPSGESSFLPFLAEAAALGHADAIAFHLIEPCVALPV